MFDCLLKEREEAVEEFGSGGEGFEVLRCNLEDVCRDVTKDKPEKELRDWGCCGGPEMVNAYLTAGEVAEPLINFLFESQKVRLRCWAVEKQVMFCFQWNWVWILMMSEVEETARANWRMRGEISFEFFSIFFVL